MKAEWVAWGGGPVWRGKLELQSVVSVAPGIKADHPSHQGVLGTELGSSARAARFLDVPIDALIRVLSTHNQEHGGVRGPVLLTTADSSCCYDNMPDLEAA